MIRISFWIFVVIYLAAFFYFGAVSQRWTDEEKSRFWTVAVCVPMTAMAGGIGWYIILCFKKRVVVLAGKYGGRAFSRDSEPFYYWSIMLFYSLFLTLLAFGLTGAFLSLFGIEITSQKVKAILELLFFGFGSFLPFVFLIGGLWTGVIKNYDRRTSPFSYWLSMLFLAFLGTCLLAFGVLHFLHPQEWK